MPLKTDNLKALLSTSIAPIIWGSTYLVVATCLDFDRPAHVALIRALPAGLIMLLIQRQLPKGQWWLKAWILGALNVALSWSFLFIAAYRLPGGVAATLISFQPLFVMLLERLFFKVKAPISCIIGGLIGVLGVALLVLSPGVGLDFWGILAALGSALTLSCGLILAKRWKPNVSIYTFTAWQLSTGGLLLLPIAILFEPALPVLNLKNIFGLLYLAVFSAGIAYILWFGGLAVLKARVVASINLLNPIAATLLGCYFLKDALSFQQLAGIAVILIGIMAIKIKS